MKKVFSPLIKHHVDPMRYPKVQKRYEEESQKAFSPVQLFGDLVNTMVDIRKEKK